MSTLLELKSEAETLLAKGSPDSADAERMAQLVEEMKAARQREADFKSLMEQISAPVESGQGIEDVPAKSLGEAFVKAAGPDGLAMLKSRSGFSISTPEFKAATDVQVTPGSFGPLLTEMDRNIVREYRRPSVLDLFGVGTLGANSNAVTYFVEGVAEGNFATVADGGQKPQIHIGDPTPTTDALTTIAAWFDVAEAMIEDADFWVSEINNRGLHMLDLAVETQVLVGDGVGANLTGVLNRSGIQTATQGTDKTADAIFKATTKVQTATGLSVDGIVINPADYEALRLGVDANGQYFGGGYFTGAYGAGGVPTQPPLWGTNTVVTPAIPAGTVAVGAFKSAATVYSKGGVRVETTNSDLGKFTKNIRTTRIETRKALAVRQPLAIVKLTLGV